MGIFDDLIPSNKPAGAALPPPAVASDVSMGPPMPPAEKPSAFADLIPGEDTKLLGELSEMTEKPQVRETYSPAQSGGLGAAAGASANFHDEIVGASKASGLPEWLGGLRAPIGVARLLYENSIGAPGNATRAYEEGRNAVRQMHKQAQEQNPKSYLTGEVVGTLATIPLAPEVTVAKGAGVGGRAANAAATGAAFGAASGAGAGEGAADTVLQAATGGAVGGATGAVAAPVLEGIGRAGKAVFGGITEKGREAEAARQVVRAIEKESPGVADAPERAATVLEQANAQGVPLVVADVGTKGGPVQRLADAASIKSPTASKAFETAFEERAGTQKDRLLDEVRNIVGGQPNATGTREALQDAARAQNKPAYARAYAAGDRPVWSPELERLTSSPEVSEALRVAAQTGKSQAVADGFGGFNPALTVTQDGRVVFNAGPKGVPTYPNIQYWDYVQRELRIAAEKSGSKTEAGRLENLRRQLNTELDKVVPEFGQARQGAARFFGADDALSAGESFVTHRGTNEEARRAVNRMTPAERELFANGFASNLVDQVRSVADRSNVINKAFLNNPQARERIEIALGPDGARRIEAFLRLEGMMQRTKDAVSGNSKTAQRFVDAGIITGGLGINAATGDFSPTNWGSLAIAGALTKAGRRTINEKVAGKVGELLASKDPQALREAVEMAARNPRLMDAIRRADSVIAKAAGRSGGPDISGVLPANVAGRAEEQQQQ